MLVIVFLNSKHHLKHTHMERYANATAAEKAIFKSLAVLITVLTHIVVRTRELRGEKSWVKYLFDLKANNPFIHVLEFGVKKGIIANLRLVVAKPTLKSDFYKKCEKLGAKAIYGGIVLHWDITEEEIPTLLAAIDKAAEASEVIELDPKRTYCDPPAGWVKDLTGKEGVTKEPVIEETVEEPTQDAPADEVAA